MNINIKKQFFLFQVCFFRSETKTGYTVLWALEEYTKLKFLHLGSKYLEKSSQ